MSRPRRLSPKGLVFHIVNRAAKKLPLFDDDGDYAAFERIMREGLQRFQVAILAYCIMPNHWHFVASPHVDGELSRFMHWITTTHACRWQAARETLGLGAVYQGRFKAIPVKADDHFLRVCRYVERNALRAGLVTAAEDWPWGSLWRRTHEDGSWLADWPVARPINWREIVNMPQTEAELAAFRSAMNRSMPFGDPEWSETVRGQFGLPPRRARGRPRRRSVL
jgi:putative transposase